MPSVLTLQSLPLFPLGTVLFPGGVLPLRIFEVRYLDMIGRCHKAGAPFGVVLPDAGQRSAASRAPRKRSPTSARWPPSPNSRHRDPGLMMIRASGAQRFRITSSDQLKHGLWVADVERLPADMAVPIPDDLKITAAALGKLIAVAAAKGRAPGPDAVAGPLAAGRLRLGGQPLVRTAALPVQLKQRLMELDNPLVRLELVSDVLTRTGIA